MNVQEKLDYLAKRQQFLEKEQAESGITSRVRQTLHMRRMTPSDLKFLPACEIKDILEDKHQTGAKSARISP